MHNTVLELAYEDGKTNGRKEEQLEIAKKLISIGLTKPQISEATGLSIKDIEKLK